MPDTSGIINFWCNNNCYTDNRDKSDGNYYSYLANGFRFCGEWTAYKKSDTEELYNFVGSGFGTIYYYESETSSTVKTYDVCGLTQINIKNTKNIIRDSWYSYITNIDYLNTSGVMIHITF